MSKNKHMPETPRYRLCFAKKKKQKKKKKSRMDKSLRTYIIFPWFPQEKRVNINKHQEQIGQKIACAAVRIMASQSCCGEDHGITIPRPMIFDSIIISRGSAQT